MILATALQPGDYAGIATLLAAFVGMPGFLLLRSIRTLRDDFEQRFESIESRVGRVEENKVGKKEWLRDSIAAHRKLDRLAEQGAKLDGRLEAQFGITSAINRLADRAVKAWERNHHD